MTLAPTATIRLATSADVPRLQAMFAEFVASTQYAKYVGNDAAYASAMMDRMIHSEGCDIFVVSEDDDVIGMLGLMVFQQPFSGETVASELFWWLDPKHRGHGGWLLKRGEKWAREKGALRMTMMAPIDKPRVAETYERLGYTAIETVFSRNL